MTKRGMQILVALGVVGVAAPFVRAVDITSCAQAVPDGDIGTLTTDLACYPDQGIVLGRGATLDLAGHSIRAAITPPAEAEGQVGISCPNGRCRVRGPGIIASFRGVAIIGLDRTRLDVTDLDIHDNGIGVYGNRVTLRNVSLYVNTDWGASANALRAVEVDSSGNWGDGLVGDTVRGQDVSVTGNGGHGVNGNRVRLSRLEARNNVGFGVRSIYPGRTRLSYSTLADNGAGDVGSERRPALPNTSCGISRQLSEGGGDLGTWGVCSAD